MSHCHDRGVAAVRSDSSIYVEFAQMAFRFPLPMSRQRLTFQPPTRL
jgi:hypothetical protein